MTEMKGIYIADKRGFPSHHPDSVSEERKGTIRIHFGLTKLFYTGFLETPRSAELVVLPFV